MYQADHTCLAVSDIEAERSFYETALNFHMIEERRPSACVRMIFLEDPSQSYRLQLISGRGKAQPGYGHTAVVCDEFEAAYAYHSEMGCVKSGIIIQNTLKSYFIVDPEGYETEILGK